jgi:nicotine blue oxidoreductase
MGFPKAFAELDGQPFVTRVVAALRSGGCRRVVVVTRNELAARVEAVCPAETTVIAHPNPDEGMLSTLQQGLARIGREPVIVALVDHPRFEPRTVRALLRAARARHGETPPSVVTPRFGGRSGHPYLIQGPALARLRSALPSHRARDLLRAERRRFLDVDDPGILRDVDTPAQLADAGGRAGRVTSPSAAPASPARADDTRERVH